MGFGDNKAFPKHWIARALAAAAYDGRSKAIFNLNRIGAPMFVIRDADSFPGENRMVAGPFDPPELPCET